MSMHMPVHTGLGHRLQYPKLRAATGAKVPIFEVQHAALRNRLPPKTVAVPARGAWYCMAYLAVVL